MKLKTVLLCACLAAPLLSNAKKTIINWTHTTRHTSDRSLVPIIPLEATFDDELHELTLLLFDEGYSILVADSRSGWNADKVKSSLEINSNPIIITGTCDRGNHAWILDGYQKRADSVLGELYYVHSNMGWSGAFDGYFLIQNSMSFQAGGDDYNRNISIYPNVRKK